MIRRQESHQVVGGRLGNPEQRVEHGGGGASVFWLDHDGRFPHVREQGAIGALMSFRHSRRSICSILLPLWNPALGSIHDELAPHAAIAMGAASRLDVAREVERARLRWREFDLDTLTRL